MQLHSPGLQCPSGPGPPGRNKEAVTVIALAAVSRFSNTFIVLENCHPLCRQNIKMIGSYCSSKQILKLHMQQKAEHSNNLWPLVLPILQPRQINLFIADFKLLTFAGGPGIPSAPGLLLSSSTIGCASLEGATSLSRLALIHTHIGRM